MEFRSDEFHEADRTQDFCKQVNIAPRLLLPANIGTEDTHHPYAVAFGESVLMLPDDILNFVQCFHGMTSFMVQKLKLACRVFGAEIARRDADPGKG